MTKLLLPTFCVALLFIAIISSASTPAQDKIDLTGTWVFQVETSAGSGTPTMVFKQEGEKLTGKYSGQLGEAELKGTVKGNQIQFSFDPGVGVVTYTGTIENGTMKGKVQLGDQASGTWTAKRKE
ncbi:MAG TPA: hypothetical protein VFZ34_22430 [Blastocatellia bacterium]|nr:hypothetical protein [Blastocatellia bacterium]